MVTINQLLVNHNGFAPVKKDDNYLSVIYTHYQYLENFKTLWYIKIEKPTRKCKFYSVYTKFTSNEMFETINKQIAFNVYSGKCNRHVNDLQQVEDFIREVQLADKRVGE